MNTALALYRFDHDRDRILRTRILECLQIIVWSIREAVSHRTEANLASVSRLSCRGHRTKGTSVETILRGNDVIFIRTVLLDTILTCHLDHSLIGFRTGVLEENLVHSDRGTYFLCEQSLWNCVRIVKGMHHILYLIDDCCHNLLIAASG